MTAPSTSTVSSAGGAGEGPCGAGIAGCEAGGAWVGGAAGAGAGRWVLLAGRRNGVARREPRAPKNLRLFPLGFGLRCGGRRSGFAREHVRELGGVVGAYGHDRRALRQVVLEGLVERVRLGVVH